LSGTASVSPVLYWKNLGKVANIAEQRTVFRLDQVPFLKPVLCENKILQLDDRQRQIYREMVVQYKTCLPRQKFAQLNRMRKHLSMWKIPFVLELLPSIATEKTLVVSDFREILLSLQFECPQEKFITSKTSFEERDKSIRNFNSGELNLLFASMELISYGIDLQQCTKLILVEPPYSYISHTQLAHRLKRIGQTEKDQLVICFLFEQTLEERLIQCNDIKEEI